MIKKGKTIDLSNNNKFKSSFGSINSENPKAIFINISSWATPKQRDEMNYGSIIRKLSKTIKQSTYLNINEKLFHPDKSIVDLNLKESGIKYGKKSYMGCEITLFQKYNYSLKELQHEIQKLKDTVINDSVLTNDHFSFHKEKK